jgi:hypothetical protein
LGEQEVDSHHHHLRHHKHNQTTTITAPSQVDLSPLSRDALSAFAINTYNALIIHALVVHGTAKYATTIGRAQFFQKVGTRGAVHTEGLAVTCRTCVTVMRSGS